MTSHIFHKVVSALQVDPEVEEKLLLDQLTFKMAANLVNDLAKATKAKDLEAPKPGRVKKLSLGCQQYLNKIRLDLLLTCIFLPRLIANIGEAGSRLEICCRGEYLVGDLS